jgi:hypothetical protein
MRWNKKLIGTTIAILLITMGVFIMFNSASGTLGYKVADIDAISPMSYPGVQLVRSSNGSLHTIYTSNVSGERSIFYSTSSDDGVTWVQTEISNRGDGNDSHPVLGVDGHDNIHVFWENDGSTDDIYYKQKTPSGWDSIVNITASFSAGCGNPNVVITSNDDISVVFSSNQIGLFQLWYLEYTNNSWQSAVQLTSEYPINIREPYITVDYDDNLHVMGRSSGGASNFTIVYLKREGGTWSSLSRIGDITSGVDLQSFPIAVVDKSNNLHVSWMAFNTTNNLERFIQYRNYTTQWNPVVNLSGDNGENFSSMPTLSIDSSNNIHIVFYGNYTGISNYQIRYKNLTSGVWSQTQNLTTEPLSQWRPKLIYQTYPYFNNPKDGYAFVFTDNETEIRYCGSPNLKWSEMEIISIVSQSNETFFSTVRPTLIWVKSDTALFYNLTIATDVNFANKVVEITDINIYNYPSACSESATEVTFQLPSTSTLPNISDKYYIRYSACEKVN